MLEGCGFQLLQVIDMRNINSATLVLAFMLCGLTSAQEFSQDVAMISFDDSGRMLATSRDLLERLVVANSQSPPSDIFIAAHGWNNSFSDARRSYRQMMSIMQSVADQHQLLKGDYRSLAIGISWPSKAWDEDADADGETSDQDVLTLYRVLPPSKGGDHYEQDVQQMLRLLASKPHELTVDDYQIAEQILRKYRLDADDDDAELFRFSEARTDSSDGNDTDDADGGLFGNRPSIRDMLRVFTYWQMKARAGTVGKSDFRSLLLNRLLQEFPQSRVHLIGHSFGCKVVLASVGSSVPPVRKVDSLCLIQGAVSFQAMSPHGGYGSASARVDGPIVATFSTHDSALGLPYELASRLAGHVAENDEDVSKFSALGRVGADRTDQLRIVGSEKDDPYGFEAEIYSANGQSHILGHSRFFNSGVARLIWSTVLATRSFPAADADDGIASCGCAELGDFDFVDEEESRLPRMIDRELLEPRLIPPDDSDDGELKVFFGNLHAHTRLSDGKGTAEEAFDHARTQAKMDFLALTEHNHTSMHANAIGHRPELYTGPGSAALIPTADRLTENGTFVCLFGQEFSSIGKGNHFNVFDIKEVIDDGEVPNGEFDKFFNAWLPSNSTPSDQVVIQMNHPWSNSPNSKEYGRDDFDSFDQWRDKVDPIAQMIEVINGPSHANTIGTRPSTINSSEFRRYIKMGFHLAPTANQDNHHETWGTITDARTAIITDELSKPKLLTAMQNRHVYASLDRNLSLIATVQGELIGSILDQDVDDGEELDLEISLRDGNESRDTYWVEVFADKVSGKNASSSVDLVATYGPLRVDDNIDNVVTFELPGLQYDGWDFIYFKIQQGPADDTQRQAYMAPVWFKK